MTEIIIKTPEYNIKVSFRFTINGDQIAEVVKAYHEELHRKHENEAKKGGFWARCKAIWKAATNETDNVAFKFRPVPLSNHGLRTAPGVTNGQTNDGGDMTFIGKKPASQIS